MIPIVNTDFEGNDSPDIWTPEDGGGRGAAVAKAFKRAVADYEIEMKIKVMEERSKGKNINLRKKTKL